MPRVFTVSYLIKEKDFSFEGEVIRMISKFGYFCSDTRSDTKVRVLLFKKKKGLLTFSINSK